MTRTFKGWKAVAKYCRKRVAETEHSTRPNKGQRAMLMALAERLPDHGVLIADEVGMGKTLVAVEAAKAVLQCGGRVAILVPTGLAAQWQDELKTLDITPPDILRSLEGFVCGLGDGDPESAASWFNAQILLISHTFSNWRFGENTTNNRFTLLPIMYARWRKANNGAVPRGYNTKVWETSFECIAEHCVDRALTSPQHPLHQYFEELAAFPWVPDDMYSASSYSSGKPHRLALERCVGMAMGAFDLIIIDEAHKNRGEASGLSRSLDTMLVRNPECRIMGMTATPVELDCTQWTDMLQRIGADKATAECAAETSQLYVEAVENLQRAWQHSPQVVEEFEARAAEFHKSLSPWVLRRTKCEDESVVLYQNLTGSPFSYAYHASKDVCVELSALTARWQQAVYAAEALSQVSQGNAERQTQRLRLTMGNGHGLAHLLDALTKTKEDDEPEGQADTNEAKQSAPATSMEAKRQARKAWWEGLIKTCFTDSAALYMHPGIQAAVQHIEGITGTDGKGEKVLVFGTYTRPLQALESLLNARFLVRSFTTNTPVPQEKIPETMREAVQMALHELAPSTTIETFAAWLEKQYKTREQNLRGFREDLVCTIAKGLPALSLAVNTKERMHNLFTAFKTSQKSHALVARAMEELLELTEGDAPSPPELAQTFVELMEHVCTSDEGDADKNGMLDEQEAHSLWKIIETRLLEDYASPRGSFARMLYGETRHTSRRTAQLAFNRTHSRLRVLVAQSRVGREGLNLHKSCRHVLLLHPEWNPGVVEQQVGRVDRVDCYWSKLLKLASENNDAVFPQIELHGIIFQGTYDEYQWSVLQQRRKALRAQFHGEIIVPGQNTKFSEKERVILERIVKSTPSFSPTAEQVRQG